MADDVDGSCQLSRGAEGFTSALDALEENKVNPSADDALTMALPIKRISARLMTRNLKTDSGFDQRDFGVWRHQREQRRLRSLPGSLVFSYHASSASRQVTFRQMMV